MKKYILLITLLPSLLWSQDKNIFSLDEAVNYALDNAYAIKNAEDDIASAKKKVWETTTMGLPQINAQIDYKDNIKKPVMLLPGEIVGAPGGYVEIPMGNKYNLTASGTLSQLIFNGSYLVGLQSSKVYLQISKDIEEKTKLIIKEGVTNAYAGVLMSEEGINILYKNKAILEKNLSDTREIVKNGFAEEQDAEQLELTLNAINIELENLKRLKKYNYDMLKYAMGISIDKEIKLSQNLEALIQKTPTTFLEKNPFNYEEHIDYKIAENSVKANELLIKLEQSKALPSINAFLNYTTSAYNEEFKLLSKDQNWLNSSIFGLSMNIPIFSSLKRSVRVQQAKIGLDKAERAQKEIAEKLKLAYQKARIEYQNAKATYENSKASLALAERIEKKESIKFFEGVSNNFQLSTAQNQLYAKQQAYLQAIFNLISKKVALETALNK